MHIGRAAIRRRACRGWHASCETRLRPPPGARCPHPRVPALHDLGRRHGGYGVQLRHYETVGAALIWTLEQGLGAAFTPATRDAWLVAYRLLAKTMQAGAAARPQAA